MLVHLPDGHDADARPRRAHARRSKRIPTSSRSVTHLGRSGSEMHEWNHVPVSPQTTCTFTSVTRTRSEQLRHRTRTLNGLLQPGTSRKAPTCSGPDSALDRSTGPRHRARRRDERRELLRLRDTADRGESVHLGGCCAHRENPRILTERPECQPTLRGRLPTPPPASGRPGRCRVRSAGGLVLVLCRRCREDLHGSGGRLALLQRHGAG